MNPERQHTIGAEATLEGTGVHTGAASRVTLRPAPEGTGIVFRRTDLDGSDELPARLDHVVSTDHGTTLGRGETRVRTVEHVLAALAGTLVDNAYVDVEGEEVAIRDGSFLDFVQAVKEAGIVDQEGDAPLLTLHAPVAVEAKNEESYVAAPAGELRISATIDFPHPAIGRQYGSFSVSPESFAGEIAPARTFGFEDEWEELRARGLALGAALENTVVLGSQGFLNEDLRFPDEFLRHKVGDILGDLALLGARVRAHIVADRPSHAGNVTLARAMAEKARRGGREALVDTARIMEYLPHRYPMLLVDRIVHFESGKRIVGIKNVTINEPFFQGHYPGHPIMPGVLIVEAMAQAGGLLLMDAVEKPEDKVVYFMSLDQVKWRRPVTPGDTLVFELEMLQFRRGICRMKGKAFVEDALVAEAELMARIMDR
ncbi:MAG: bifunctional UDP-3-O-[3-hydroxymyristoyl] N-acetylglucosamine deacetylase/3-hydroxyacyl-ACP dehydratase [Gemmatimonadota bacterium]